MAGYYERNRLGLFALVPDGVWGKAPECPYCGRPVEELADGKLVCALCELWWGDEEELEIEREAVNDEDEPPGVE